MADVIVSACFGLRSEPGILAGYGRLSRRFAVGRSASLFRFFHQIVANTSPTRQLSTLDRPPLIVRSPLRRICGLRTKSRPQERRGQPVQTINDKSSQLPRGKRSLTAVTDKVMPRGLTIPCATLKRKKARAQEVLSPEAPRLEELTLPENK